MILTDYLYPERDITWDFALQCGVTHGTIRLPEDGKFSYSDKEHWHALIQRFRTFGITPYVVEPLPNPLHEHIKRGDEKRDWAIGEVLKMLPIARSEGIRVICFNFMAYVGWLRTRSDISERGGAKVTGFSLDEVALPKEHITEEQLWENYRYFLSAVLPEAEKCGILLALHPDDPPLARLGAVSRIFTSYDHILQGMQLVPSPNLGVTFCQATYRLMGADLQKAVKEDLRQKIFFVHFRNCRGTKEHFQETFHDNGEIDMARMIQLYTSFLPEETPIRVDHVPLMAGEGEGRTGYTALGRLYAIGYLKGLLEMVKA